MEDDLKFKVNGRWFQIQQRQPLFLLEKCISSASAGKPTWTWAWHSSAPACSYMECTTQHFSIFSQGFHNTTFPHILIRIAQHIFHHIHTRIAQQNIAHHSLTMIVQHSISPDSSKGCTTQHSPHSHYDWTTFYQNVTVWVWLIISVANWPIIQKVKIQLIVEYSEEPSI